MNEEQPPSGWPASRPWKDSGWLSVDQARTTPGVRITDSPYWAALWSQVLRGILHVKRIPYHKVVHPPYSHADPDAQRPLLEWTAQTSVPTMISGDGTPYGDVIRNDWLNQLMLAEQLQPEPSLIPSQAKVRVKMFGLANEIMSPQGLMWNGRLAMAALMDTTHLTEKQRDFFSPGKFLGGKYAHNAKAKEPMENMRECLSLLDEQLSKNGETGSPYFCGDKLSALDIYWAYASIMAKALPPDEMPVMRVNRAMYPPLNEAIADALTPRLLAHRAFIFDEHLELPMAVD